MKIILYGITGMLALVTLLFGGLWFGFGTFVPTLMAGVIISPTDIGEGHAYLDNTIRFLAGIWLLCGIGLFVSMRDFANYGTLHTLLMMGLVVGGLGRLLSAVNFGMPSIFVGPTVLELVLPPIAIWLRIKLFGRITA